MEAMSPESLMRLLKNHGVSVTNSEATFILDFMKKIVELGNKIEDQHLLQKPVLNFSETCRYLQISPSHLYKLTSQKDIPHFCPQGKKLYFRREEIDQWLLRNRQSSADEIDHVASDYIIRNKRGK